MYNRDVIAEWALFQTADHKGVVVDGSERRVHAGLVRNLVHASDNHPDNAFAYPQVVLSFAVSGQEEAVLSHRLDRIVSFIVGSDLRHCTPRHTRAPGAMCPSVGQTRSGAGITGIR